MTLSLLYSIAIAILVLTIGVFVISFRLAFRETNDGHGDRASRLPTARVRDARMVSGDGGWRTVAWRATGRPGARPAHIFQAGLVAVGISAVFLMVVCMASICVAMFASAV